MRTAIFICSCPVERWIGVLAGLLWMALPLALPAQTHLASLAFEPSATAQGGSYNPLFSADSRHIVFESFANNLVSNDNREPFLDLFLRDLDAQSTTLTSVGVSGEGGGNGHSHSPALSADGRYIAFVSDADNLVAADTNRASDIFLRDHITQRTWLISAPASGQGSALGDLSFEHAPLCAAPQISADGQWIVYQSRATNLVNLPDFNESTDVFAHDRADGQAHLVSSTPTAAGNGPSKSPSLASIGLRVAFVSHATDLIPQSTSQQGEVYVRDLVSGELLWASTNAWTQMGARSFSPVISDQGADLAFFAVPLSGSAYPILIHHHISTGLSRIVASNAVDTTAVALSPEGRFVAYAAGGQIYLWDATTGEAEHISVDLPGGIIAEVATRPSLSGDGTRVAFLAERVEGIAQLFLRDRVQQITHLASLGVNTLTNQTDLAVTFPVLSRDGRSLAFESTDPALVLNDRNSEPDIFVRQLDLEQTGLISFRSPDLPATTATAPVLLWPRSVSADGQRIAFTASDGSLAPNDTNLLTDAFLHDAVARTTIPVSVLGTNQPGALGVFQNEGNAHSTVLSSDGNVLAYITGPSFGADLGLQAGDLRSVHLGTGQRVSVTSTIADSFIFPALSSDGRWVVALGSSFLGILDRQLFVADLSDPQPMARLLGPSSLGIDVSDEGRSPLFSPNDERLLFISRRSLTFDQVSGLDQLYAYHFASNNITLVSRAGPFQTLRETVDVACFSGDSLYAAFHTTTSNRIYRHHFARPDDPVLLVCTNASQPSLNQDGQWLAYTSHGQRHVDIYLRNIPLGQTTLVSINTMGTGGGDADSFAPSLSSDQRYVLFASRAGNLVDNDHNGQTDVFLRDLTTQTTFLLSLNHAGTASGNRLSSHPILSRDERIVVFSSFASDLVPGDYNTTRDIFLVRLAAPDTDQDGMDDDWELTYFDTLDRDGSADFDQDGQTDREEFRAGTDPTNSASLFRAITVRRLDGQSTTVLWAAVPGCQYQVQYKERADGPTWTPLPGFVTAQGQTGSYVDLSATNAPHRFYRIVK